MHDTENGLLKPKETSLFKTVTSFAKTESSIITFASKNL